MKRRFYSYAYQGNSDPVQISDEDQKIQQDRHPVPVGEFQG